VHRQAEVERATFHGTHMQQPATAGGAIRLREYGANPMLRGQPVERGNCEVRRAGEAQLQRRGSGAQSSKSRRVSA
jgi:hypothetical protein